MYYSEPHLQAGEKIEASTPLAFIPAESDLSACYQFPDPVWQQGRKFDLECGIETTTYFHIRGLRQT